MGEGRAYSVTSRSTYAVALGALVGCAFLAAASPHAFAGINEWTGTGPNGGFVDTLAIDPADDAHLYIIVRGGFYSTRNGGDHWLPAATPPPDGVINLVADPHLADTLYALISGGLPLASSDGGNTWHNADHLPPAETAALAFDPTDPATRLASTSLGMLRSTNSGASWEAKTSGLPAEPAREIAITNGTPVVAYARYADKLFRSEDKGETWAPAQNGLPSACSPFDCFLNLAVDPSNAERVLLATSSGIFETTDRGDSWQRLGSLPGGANAPLIRRLAITPQDSSVLYLGTAFGLYRTSDAAESWTRVDQANGRLSTRSIDVGRHSRVVYVTTDGWYPLSIGGTGVRRSLDQGATWGSASAGLHHSEVCGIALTATTPFSALAAVCDGSPDRVYRQSHPGEPWSASQTGIPSPKGHISRVAFDAVRPSVAYAAIDETIYRSDDGGESWRPTSGVSFPVAALVPDPRSTDTLYAVSSQASQILKTTDGGGTWRPLGSGLPEGAYLRDLAVDGLRPNRLYCGTSAGVYRSMDGGERWQRVAASQLSDVTAVVVAPSGVVFVIGSFALFRSVDNAATFEAVHLPFEGPATALVADPVRPGFVYATGHEALAWSANDGLDWQTIGAAPINVHRLYMSAAAPGVLYAATLYHGVQTYTRIDVPRCAGDCNADQSVSIDEVIRLVNLALGSGLPLCAAGDSNGDAEISVEEIVSAVRSAVMGCAVQ